MGGSVANKIVANVDEADTEKRLSEHLRRLLSKRDDIAARPVIILCIGSDRYTGDALGPLVGSYLLEQGTYPVVGSLDCPVHAGNLVENVRMIRARYFRPLIIAVDACLGKMGEVGNIEIWEGGVEAGIAVGHKLPCVGDISIVGVVNMGGYHGFIDLQTTPLSIVVKLSKVIGKAVVSALKFFPVANAAASLHRD